MRKDPVTLKRAALVHPELRNELLDIYEEVCVALSGKAMCRFTETFRTFAEQNTLYAKGRTTPGPIVTKAKGGQSYHNYGLAVDIALIVDKDGNGSFESASWDVKADFDGDSKSDWMEVVEVFKQYGWEWGGNWKFYDAPHFQKTFGYSVRQLEELYNNKKVDANNYVLI